MVAYSFKERFVDPIQMGLGTLGMPEAIPGEAIVGGRIIRPKRQTIRANGKRRHARAGEVVQLYYGMRTKFCRSIGVAKCTEAPPIYLGFGAGSAPLDRVRIFRTSLDEITGAKNLDAFARLDGFDDWADMRAFWQSEHQGITDFSGTLIEWEPIR